MYYTIEIPFWLMSAFCFILGLSIGLGVNIWFLKPPRPKRPAPPLPEYNPSK